MAWVEVCFENAGIIINKDLINNINLINQLWPPNSSKSSKPARQLNPPRREFKEENIESEPVLGSISQTPSKFSPSQSMPDPLLPLNYQPNSINSQYWSSHSTPKRPTKPWLNAILLLSSSIIDPTKCK